MASSLSGLTHQPPLREMRAQLEQKITALQQLGFDAFMEAEALAAQQTDGETQEREKTTQVAVFRAKAKNVDLAVTRLKELLATLPAPEERTR